MDKLEQQIKMKRELLMRDTFSRRGYESCDDMPDDQKINYIRYLEDRRMDLELDKKAMKLVMEDLKKENDQLKEDQKEFDERQKSFEERLATLEQLLYKESKARQAAERKAKKLEEQNRFLRKNSFGSKKQSSKKRGSDKDDDNNIPNREEEKEGFDGTEESLSTKSVPEKEEQESDAVSKPERDPANRPETYRTMGVNGTPLKHYSDLSKVPGRILARKMVKVFRLNMFLTEEQYEMVQYVEKGKKPRWAYFPKEGHPQAVPKFQGTKATPEFLQAIAYEVYVKNVTFGLLHQWLQDMGMAVSANTLRNWLKKGKVYLDRLVVELKRIALEKDSIVNCDETWCKVRKYDKYRKRYMWVLVNKAEQVAIFFYEDGSRGRDVLKDFLGDAELKAVMSDGYNAYVFIGNELKSAQFKDIVHLICMAHVRAKFLKASLEGRDRSADLFIYYINRLYKLERQYDAEGLSPEERRRRRQGLETKEIMINLRANLMQELGNEDSMRSSYMTEALNYLNRFWKEVFNYLKDGNFPIDNNAAERAVRPFTTKRKNSLHFGSNEGAEMAATYHSVISTVKLQCRSTWEFLGKFFSGIFNGCTDFLSLVPQNIGLGTCR